jgi:hypothetical protein
LTIPASVEHIGKRAFADNRLDSAMLSSPKTTIGEGSFDHNTDAYEGNIKSPFPIFQP